MIFAIAAAFKAEGITLDEAIACYRRAVELFDQLSDRYYYAAIVLSGLGDTCALAGQSDQAQAAWQRAAAIFDDVGVVLRRARI